MRGDADLLDAYVRELRRRPRGILKELLNNLSITKIKLGELPNGKGRIEDENSFT